MMEPHTEEQVRELVLASLHVLAELTVRVARGEVSLDGMRQELRGALEPFMHKGEEEETTA